MGEIQDGHCQRPKQLRSGGFPQYIEISYSGGSSVSQNKLPQLILGYIYILKYLQSNFIG